MRLSAVLLSTLALVAGAPSAGAESHRAAPFVEAALPGHVCFWPEADEMGAGGGWCYSGTGYAEAAPHVKRHAKSFNNQTQDTFYAIHFPRDGGCLYRTVYGGDYSAYWEWWDKLDGIQRVRPTDCLPG
ncbi:hypothetical protein ACFWFI_21870 [Streptomyces sp. NPDC060209]|uniref:hypothetical protein n=1 Tax=Streptomyces sp. NPDC060209 TaxID=3347073 RepID=UPI003661F2C3